MKFINIAITIVALLSICIVGSNSNMISSVSSLSNKIKLRNSDNKKEFKIQKSLELVKDLVPFLIYDFKLSGCDMMSCCLEYLSKNSQDLLEYHNKVDYASKTAVEKLFNYEEYKGVLNSVSIKKCKCLDKDLSCGDILKFKKEYEEETINRKIRNYFPEKTVANPKKYDLLIDATVKDRKTTEVGNILARVNKISEDLK